jgi:glycosyltransferase involved in cell wall biosynthesis
VTDVRSRPRVTIGIPLYAAQRWFEHIADNIERLASAEVEFLVADQHLLDDTVERLRARFGGRVALRCHASRDALDWIGNYNFLLQHARGEYFRILTQDDAIDASSLAAAVAALDADPDCVLVVGPADQVDPQGASLLRDPRLPASTPVHDARQWRRDALRLFAGTLAENANLGLVRTRVAHEQELRIPFTAGATGLSVRVFLFALALRGGIRYLPDYASRRCVHPHSYTATHWRRSPRAQAQRALSYLHAGARVWRAAPMPALARLAGWPLLAIGTASMTMSRLLRRLTPRFRRSLEAQRPQE